jgi:lambda repressor-like predicted transcriptional regulator
LAQFLKDQLDKRGVSMRAASLYAGLGPGAFHAYTTDHYRPNPEACKKIADYLEIPYSHVLRLAGHIDEPLSPGRRPGTLSTLNPVQALFTWL